MKEMAIFASRRGLVVAFLLGACGSAAFSQNTVSTLGTAAAGTTTGTKDTTHVNAAALRDESRIYVKQLGSRLTGTGKERGAISGTYTDSSGSAPFDLVWQNPGQVQLTVHAATAKTLTFDGSTAGATVGSTALKSGTALASPDQDLLDTLADDYPEAFFFSLANNAAYRLLGTRFRTDDGKDPKYAGPYFAVYQRIATTPSAKTATQKLFMFDTSTGLLARVAYLNPTDGTPVEVQYSNWKVVNGEQVPGTIVRQTSAGPQFTLTLGTVSFGPAGSTQIFAAAQ